MALPVKLVAAALATTAAASAAAYIVINSENAGPTTAAGASTGSQTAAGGAGPADPSGDDVPVCVGGDRILRVPPGFASECPAGQNELALPEADERLCELCDPLEDPPPEPADSDSAALEDIERRIADLENTPYFEVLSQKDEKPILRVEPGGVRLFNESGQTVALFGTSDDGGHFTARSTTTGGQASVAASGHRAAVLIRDEAMNRVELGTRDGPFALRFPAGQGLIAGLGQSRTGTGAVLVGTLPGVTQASFTVSDGRGMVSVSKDGVGGGVALTEATIGGGLLDISNNAGNSAVKMGHNGHRYGIVMAGPILGAPYVPRLGIPGSYFMGCAGNQSPPCADTIP